MVDDDRTRSQEQQIYQVRIRGHLPEEWSDWFSGLEIDHRQCGDTLLTGPLPDQAALHGVLIRIRDLGLTLVEVTQR